jgi:hypothetical protein
MGAFMKIASLAVVIVVGSLLALWLAFVNVPLAWVALVAMVLAASVVIVFIARDTRRLDRSQP